MFKSECIHRILAVSATAGEKFMDRKNCSKNKQKRLGGHITNASAVPEVIAGLEYEFFLTGYISK